MPHASHDGLLVTLFSECTSVIKNFGYEELILLHGSVGLIYHESTVY